MNKFTFNNKEEYLAYRSAWKAEYKELSKTIRERRWLTKEHQRAYSKTYVNLGDPFSKVGHWDTFDKYMNDILAEIPNYKTLCEKQNFRIGIDKLRDSANNMMVELTLSKVEAQRRYIESKNLVGV